MHTIIILHYCRTTSTRLLSCLWWMFALLMVSCYTANLSAFLTIQRMEQSFSRPEDLINHPEIRSGAVRRGATNNFIRVGFQRVVIGTCFTSIIQNRYRELWDDMEEVDSLSEGLSKVRGGKFVFFMESPRLEFEVARDCGLLQVGRLLNSRYYALGLPKGEIKKLVLQN